MQGGGIRIVVTNCVISTRWSAVRLGPATQGLFRDIAVSNCVIYDTYGAAVKIQEVEGGVMENISFDNLVMNHVTGPISLRLGGYLGLRNERKESLPIGILRNIRFSNIQATVSDNAYPLPHEVPAFPGEKKSCINITGVPGYWVENIVLSGVHITFPGGGGREDARRSVPELPRPLSRISHVRHAAGLWDLCTPRQRINARECDPQPGKLRPASIIGLRRCGRPGTGQLPRQYRPPDGVAAFE